MPRNKPKKPLIEAPPEPESSSGSSDGEPEISDHKTPPPSSKKPTTKKPDPSQPVSKSKPNFISRPTVAALPAQVKHKDSSKRARKEKHSLVGPGPGPGNVPEGSPRKLFERVFSEDDEIVILKGLIEFKESGEGDPLKSDDQFCDFVKKLLHAEVNKVQIVDKIRRLKKKFYVNKKKKRKISNEHDKKVFELSKQIWEHDDDDNGNNNDNDNNNVGLKSSSKGLSGNGDNNWVFIKDKEVGDEGFKDGEIDAKEGIRVEAFRRMGAKQRDEIREMWRKVEIAQLKLDLMRCEARVEENKRIMEALGLGKY